MKTSVLRHMGSLEISDRLKSNARDRCLVLGHPPPGLFPTLFLQFDRFAAIPPVVGAVRQTRQERYAQLGNAFMQNRRFSKKTASYAPGVYWIR
jgi:hypothetical protein